MKPEYIDMMITALEHYRDCDIPDEDRELIDEMLKEMFGL